MKLKGIEILEKGFYGFKGIILFEFFKSALENLENSHDSAWGSNLN